MAKIDLHCHSVFSEHPSEWFLQRLGAAESYTEPDFLYQEQLKNGMDFVTITDHNRIGGALLLKEKYPDKIITGVESTVYFPEDNNKIHVLLFGITEKQFSEVQKIRTDIYQFRDYIRYEKIAHSVAHATYSVNGKLNIEHLKKLLLLFDYFEGINGGRNKLNNDAWLNVLLNLTPEHIENLRVKYKIQPYSDTPWVKGITAGSDDHSGLYLGKTYTVVEANTTEDVILQLKAKKSACYGRHNDFQSLAFTVYKIAMDFSKTKSNDFSKTLLGQLTDFIVDNKALSWKYSLSLKAKKKKKIDEIESFNETLKENFSELVDTLKKDKELPIDNKFDLAYDKIADIIDIFLKSLFQSTSKELGKGNIIKMIRNISSGLPGVFLTLPFFSTLNHMYKNRDLLTEIQKEFGCLPEKQIKKILWFTDTFSDLNGVSVTLQKVHQTAIKNNYPLAIVSYESNSSFLKGNFLNLPVIHEFKLPYYEQVNIKIPSLLKAMKKIYEYQPEEIVISTPGPIGLIGLLVGKLLNVKIKSIYHTDFKKQVYEIQKDESLSNMLDTCINWFYQQTDEIYVTTEGYMNILEERGIDRSKMRLFSRGIDLDIFYHKKFGKVFLQHEYNIKAGIYFIYTGRISQDKNLEIVADAFLSLAEKYHSIYLLLVGEGPYRSELQKKYYHERIIFTGRIDRDSLSDYYSGSEFFVFPSTTDTFGMSVIEAQACGLPALVSDQGGPKDIIIDNETGYIIESFNTHHWEKKMEECILIYRDFPSLYENMQNSAQKNARKSGDWKQFLHSFLNYG